MLMVSDAIGIDEVTLDENQGRGSAPKEKAWETQYREPGRRRIRKGNRERLSIKENQKGEV